MSDDQRYEQFYTLCKKHVERGHVLDVRQLDTLAEWVQNWHSVWSKPIEDRPIEAEPALDELHQAILDALGETARLGCSWMSAEDILRNLFSKRDSDALGYERLRLGWISTNLEPSDVVEAIRRMRLADPNLDDRIEEGGRDGVVDYELYRLRD